MAAVFAYLTDCKYLGTGELVELNIAALIFDRIEQPAYAVRASRARMWLMHVKTPRLVAFDDNILMVDGFIKGKIEEAHRSENVIKQCPLDRARSQGQILIQERVTLGRLTRS